MQIHQHYAVKHLNFLCGQEWPPQISCRPTLREDATEKTTATEKRRAKNGRTNVLVVCIPLARYRVAPKKNKRRIFVSESDAHPLPLCPIRFRRGRGCTVTRWTPPPPPTGDGKIQTVFLCRWSIVQFFTPLVKYIFSSSITQLALSEGEAFKSLIRLEAVCYGGEGCMLYMLYKYI